MAETQGAPPLAAVGLRPGDSVRWQRRAGGRWQTGKVAGRERDGSIAVHDSRGAARALPIERLEVRTAGPRGAKTWEPLAQRAARTEQMDLF